METSDLVQARMFAAVHSSLPTRSNAATTSTITDTSLLFSQNGTDSSNLMTRTPIGRLTGTNNATSSICNPATGAALMNAFGLASGLQLPVGLWDTSLFNAALSQYIDASSPLLR